MRRLALGVVVATTSLAHAGTPEHVLGDQQLELEPRRNWLDDDDSVTAWTRFAGFAQLTGGGRDGGDAGAGVAIAAGGIGCDLAAVTAQGRFRPLAESGEPLGQVTYSVCPFAALMTLKFEGRRGTGIVPALDARRSLWNRAYTDVYDRMEIAFGPYWKHDGDPLHSIFVFALGHGTMKQSDGLETRTIKTLDIDFTAYRFQTALVSIDALSVRGDGIKAGPTNQGGVATSFDPVRVRVGTDDLYMNAELGWGFTGGQITASGSTMVNDKTVSEWEDTIDSEGLPDLTTWVGAIEAGVRRDRVKATGRLARGFYPTFDGNLAREARASGEVTYVAGRTRRTTVSIAPFAARTRTWERDAPSTLEISAGAQLHVGRELSRKLRIDAIGEAGVSPYSRSETERLPVPAIGGQFVVAVSGRVTDLQH